MKKLTILLSFIFLLTQKSEQIIGYCDIKGYVNKPGVYEIKENYTIQDIIKEAGGLKNNAYTNNINLSKKVYDEMVIYIFSENEINNIKEINNCKCEPTYKYIECEPPITIPTTTTNTTTTPITTTIPKSTTIITSTTEIPTTINTTTTSIINTTTKSQTKININTCTKEELINIKGLGEIKANKIIEYRNNNGMFESIEDLLKVDGIGESTLAKIKEYIEI